MGKSWAEKHPIITGALVGSIVPGIGTIAGALGGVIYDITTRWDEEKSPSPADNAAKRQEQFEKERGQ